MNCNNQKLKKINVIRKEFVYLLLLLSISLLMVGAYGIYATSKTEELMSRFAVPDRELGEDSNSLYVIVTSFIDMSYKSSTLQLIGGGILAVVWLSVRKIPADRVTDNQPSDL
jgi:hypothetical protein